MRPILCLALLSIPAFAVGPIDTPRLERLLGLGHGPSRPVDEPLPSPLPWRLLGTLRDRHGTSMAAVDQVTRSVTLQVGDVRDGVEVIAIEQQVLVVRRLGRLERIGSRPGSGGGFGVAGPPQPAGRTLSRQVVDRALANPASLMGEVQLLPALVDGKWAGFRARWVKEGSLVASLGLRSGDTLTRVNGVSLDSPERVLSLLQALATTRRFEVELEREGKRVVEAIELDR
jgi:type II secretion system protein C